MKCLKCLFENPDDNRFCRECGASLLSACPKCGVEILPGDKFCGKCGHGLKEPKEAPPIDYNQPQTYTPKHLADKILTTRNSIEGERKLVTVLFADAVNYTAMSEKLDPEEVHQIMDGCFRILIDQVHHYEGTINQFTGDGIMALFGAPIAHEDHAQRACHAALSIQEALVGYAEKLKKNRGIDYNMRIGLNSGLVIVGGIGDDLQMDYTAIGDTVNLASRMESMATPGGVLVSENTHRLVRDFFEFESLGKIEVKGKKEPQEAFGLIKAGEVETRIGASVSKGLTRFVGRKNSMPALLNAFDKVKSGSGQVVGLVGDAGVGKSRLLLEMKNNLPRDEYIYLEGRCLQYGGSMAYLPVLYVLRSYLDIKEGDREFLVKKKMEEKILGLDEKLKNVIPPFQSLLSLKVDDEDFKKLEPKEKRERTFEALRDMLIRGSQEKPLILAIEDIHWVDKTSEEFFDYMIGGLANTPILLILLYRPEYTHSWGSKSYYTKIGLDQLGTASSSELVKAILEKGEVAPELRQLILNRAAGNPLFMEEFTHTLLENGSIERKNERYVLSEKASDIQVPDTIQGIIAARMDRLEDNLKRTMQVASVIGRDFAFRILQAITEMREELKSCLLNLQGLEFIYEKRLFPELEYIFKHALTQEVAYNSLLLKRRKEIHAKIGGAIEALYSKRLEEFYEMLAYHYGRSANTDKAVEYLDLANQKAAKLNAMEEAKTYLDEAMELLDTMPDTDVNRQRRISLLVNQGIVFLMLFRSLEYYDLLTHYEPMARELENPELLGAFYARLGHCEYSFGSFDHAIQTLTKAAELAETSGNTEDAGYAYVWLGWIHVDRGDYRRALALKDDVFRSITQRFNLRLHTYALSVASRACSYLGHWDRAVEEGQKALSVAQEGSDNSLISWSAWNLSIAYSWRGDLAQAVEYGEIAVQKAPTSADKAFAQRSLGWALCRAGEISRGIELLVNVGPIFRAAGLMVFEIPLTCYLGEGHWLAGKDDKAMQTLEKSLKIAERYGARYYIGYAQRLLGEITLKTNPAQAASCFEKSIAVLREIKAENELAMAYAGYGRLHKKQGEIARAREYLTKALEIFERLGTLIEPDKVREELIGLLEA